VAFTAETFISAPEAAERLDVSTRTVYRLARPALASLKKGRRWYVSEADVEILKARRAGTGGAGGDNGGHTCNGTV
jgi:excisionase family DNA binding protein